MEFKGYTAKIEFDNDAGLFHGQVLHTRDVITFQGTSVDELRTAFADSIDDYLEFCAARGEEPEKPFSGRFLVRVDPALHRQVAIAASHANESLNTWVSNCLERSTMPAPSLHRIAMAILRTGATAHAIQYSKRITDQSFIGLGLGNDYSSQLRPKDVPTQEKLVHRHQLDLQDLAKSTNFSKQGYASVS